MFPGTVRQLPSDALATPDYFVDEQVRGPFRSFRHVHEFREDAGRTVMVDRIEFAAPFGPLGRLAEKLILTRYLRKLIEHRNRHLTAGARTAKGH